MVSHKLSSALVLNSLFMILAIFSVASTTSAISAPLIHQPAQLSRGELPKRPQPSPTSTTPNQPVKITEIEVKAESGELPPELRDRVLKAITAKVGEPVTQAQLDRDVQAIQATGSFQSVRIEPTQTPQGTKLTFIVKVFGVLNRVSIKTLPDNRSSVIPQADIDKIFGGQYGQPLNTAAVAGSIKKLNALYKERGFELAQIVNVENPTADGQLVLIVAEGVIEDVQVRFMNAERRPIDDQGEPIQGQTRDFIITREVELRPGKVYNRKTIEKDLRRVYRLGLFEDLGLAFLPGQKDPSQVILQINVLEAKKSNVVGASGTVGASGFSFGGTYNQVNLGGNNQTLSANGSIGSLTQGDISFTDPWIAGDPNRTSYTVSIFQQRSLPLIFEGGPTPVFLPNSNETPRIVRTGGGIFFSRPLDGNPYSDEGWLGSVGLKYQRVSVQDGNGQVAPIDGANKPLSISRSGQDDLLTAQIGLFKDTRDSRFQPTQGSVIRLGLDQTIPIGESNIKLTKLNGSYTQYIPVNLVNFDKGPQSISFNIQGGTALGDLPPYEAYALGGVSSVRGYEDSGLATGRSYIRLSTEYQFPIVSFLGGALFADYGSDLGTGQLVPGNPAGTRGKPGSGFGYGAGLRLNSPLGPLQLNYGINDRGESRVQFGLNLQN
jgi:outer membrane protein insertion porin family